MLGINECLSMHDARHDDKHTRKLFYVHKPAVSKSINPITNITLCSVL